MAGWGDSTLTPLSRPPAPHPRALRRVIPPPRHLHRRNPGHQPAHPAASWGAVLTPRAASPPRFPPAPARSSPIHPSTQGQSRAGARGPAQVRFVCRFRTLGNSWNCKTAF